MLDPEFIRENVQKIKEILKNGRGDSSKADIDLWVELDKKRSDLIQQRDQKKEERNSLSKNITGKPDQATIDKVKILKQKTEEIENNLNEIVKKWQEILDWMPNMPFEEVPIGKTEDENVEIKAWIPGQGYLQSDKLGKGSDSGQYMPLVGSNADESFEPKPHWEITTKLKILDLEAGAKVSGSRFYYIKNEGVLLLNGIFQMLMKKLVWDGFEPMIVPLLVRERALYGTSQFPGDADQVYKLDSKYLEDENSLYLTGSSEPSNFAYFMDTVLDFKELPKKVMAQTTCFRSEVGSWGKDVRGMKRTHQFDKLEMNIIIEANDDLARETQEYLLSMNEWLLQELELPYHVINMCYGDLGYYAAAKKYDVEVWTPSQKSYMEVMSNSITTDYQTRRLNIKYKGADGKTKYAYTLNDTGATHRLLIAIIEHYQQVDGSIKVPRALVEYVGKEVITKKDL